MENSFGVKSLLKGFFIRLDANLFLSFDLVYMGFEQILFAIYKNILALRKLSFAPDQSLRCSHARSRSSSRIFSLSLAG